MTLTEPEAKDMIDSQYHKQLSGGDQVRARDVDLINGWSLHYSNLEDIVSDRVWTTTARIYRNKARFIEMVNSKMAEFKSDAIDRHISFEEYNLPITKEFLYDIGTDDFRYIINGDGFVYWIVRHDLSL